MNPGSFQAYTIDVAVAAPLWQGLTYALSPELAPLVNPLTRLLVPLRGKPRLGFALGHPQPGDSQGLRWVMDVVDDVSGPPAWPPALLGFFTRAAAHYQAPLGQALAWCLPAGLGSVSPQKAGPIRSEQEAMAALRQGRGRNLPRAGTQAARILEILKQQGPQSLPELRRQFPRATALCKKLEAQGWVSITHRPLVRDLLGRPLWPEPRPQRLSEDQQTALGSLAPAIEKGEFRPFLLHGVTGSGKTEVYLACCEKALARGRQALILTPEIGLCLRLEGLLRSRFNPEKVAVLHSGLTPAARRGQWLAIASGKAQMVVGARSAVFAPLQRPGIICVDEEQDEGYKQEDRLRYNARDLALLRGQEQSCPVLLGTATPSVTTIHRAHKGELTLLSMPRRIQKASLPRLEVVDLRSAGRLQAGFMSSRLHQALRETVAQGRQAILFLNRRGFAPALLCPSCGRTLGCPACSLSLTLHQGRGRLLCHTCGHERPIPSTCPECGAPAEQMKPLGLGTEAVAARLAELEPGMRLARLDRDTAGDPKKLGALLKQIADHQVDVVVGTQMITKGHHFPLISLVGVLLADQALALPDFRAGERAFILLTQVAGRAGREQGPGLVIVQTYDPEHHALRAAVSQDWQGFYQTELSERRALGYPPFKRLMSLRLEGARESAVMRAAGELARHLESSRLRAKSSIQVLGPAPAPVARTQGRFRYLILMKSASPAALGRTLHLARHKLGDLPAGVRLMVDVDPLSLI